MKRPYRAAVIGCGRIGSLVADSREALGVYSHAEAYAVCPSTELVAVGDRDLEKAKQCAQRWHVPQSFDSAGELFDVVAPEIVSICTPNETHFDIGMAALGIPGIKALLMEKPLALEPEQAVALALRAEERGVLLAVNYSRRYSAGFGTLRDRIRAGFLGRIQTVNGFYTKGVIHNGTHWFDLARFLLGEVKRVWGFGQCVESDSELHARLEFASGAAGYLHSCDGEAYAIFEMDIVGTHGRVRIVDLGHEMEVFTARESVRHSGYRELTRVGEPHPSLRDLTLHAVEDLAGCLDEPGRLPLCSASDALQALEIALAVNRSVQSGNPVEVPEREPR